MAPSYATGQEQAHDGERLRDLWAPGDGSGDPDKGLIKTSLNCASGHPTWKLFCGDISDGPPTRVYLDDKACYDLYNSGKFAGQTLGRHWPFDFGQHGNIRATRPNRGRPAYTEGDDGEPTIAVCRKAGTKGYYQFWGEGGNPETTSRKKRLPGFVELDSTVQQIAENKANSPGPMEIMRQDKTNLARAGSAADYGGAVDGSVSTVVETGADAGRMQAILDRPMSAVQVAELDSLRVDMIYLTKEFKSLEKRFAEAQLYGSKAQNENFTLKEALAAKAEESKQYLEQAERNLLLYQSSSTQSTKSVQDVRVQKKVNERLQLELAEAKVKIKDLESGADARVAEKAHPPSNTQQCDNEDLQAQVDLLTALAQSLMQFKGDCIDRVAEMKEAADKGTDLRKGYKQATSALEGVCKEVEVDLREFKKLFEDADQAELWQKVSGKTS